MKNLLLSASALLCAAAWAQSPSLPYRSVFADTVKGVETQSLDWKRANARVAELPRGHIDALKWEKAHDSPAPATSPPTPDLRSEKTVAMARQNHPALPAADTQKAWTNAVAAQQSAKYLRDVRDAAEAGLPFVELALGLGYLANVQPMLTNAVAVVVMGFSATDVIGAVLDKRRIRCACLGTVLQLPMSTVNIMEDVALVAMAEMALAM